MGVNLSIKSVPEAWAERLRQRAEQNHRSLQGELMALLERAVHEGAMPPPQQSVARGSRQGPGLSIEEVSRLVEETYSALPARPDTIPTGAEIVREMRDSRWA